MATKKEKRARAMERREKFMQKYREDGLAALKADLERREKLKAEAEAEQDKKNREMLKGKSAKFARMAKNGKTPKDEEGKEITVGEYLDAVNSFFAIDVTDGLRKTRV